MNKPLRFASLLLVALLAFNSQSQAQKMWVLTTNDLFYSTDASNLAMMSTPMAVTGLPSGMSLVGMDVRPATGQVYLFGYNSAQQMAQVFTLDTTNGMLSAIGMGISNLVLEGQVGFDFNPTVDRIRVVSSGNQDYRLHPTTGALVATDGTLMYAASDVNAGVNPNIGSAAYTNSFIGSTSTTLYNYDDSLNVLTIQNPPNNGVQNTVGSSGLMQNLMDATSSLDIYFNPSNMQNVAYLAANTGSNTIDSLYSINLSTGMTTVIGSMNMAVKEIAFHIDRTAPALTGVEMYALASNNNLLRFNTSDPSYLISATPVSGLTAGQTLVGMDVRPVDLKLYGIGYNAATMVARIYTIEPATGVATPVSADSITNIDLSGRVGVDFNPVADRIRVVTSNNKNYRFNQLNGLLAATDSMLSYKMGDVNFGVDPDVSTSAYTNSIVAPTGTLLYTHDDSLNVLLTQDPPNDGLLNTIGATGLMLNAMDRTSDMDIYYDHATQMNIAYFAANVAGSFDQLYTINLATGAATLLGSIGMGVAVLDIAAQLAATPPATSVKELNKAFNGLEAYPNPLNGALNLRFSLPTDATVQIALYDLTGKKVSTLYNQNTAAGSHALQFETSSLPSGMYLLRFESQGQSQVIKLVK
jgi:trimeric autotransporter adhesin